MFQLLSNMSIISIGAQCGGPDASLVGDLKVPLYQALVRNLTSSHCAAVDEYALVDRIVKRAKETEARGEPVRKDDNPDVFKTRLDAYRKQTAPLSAYYDGKGMLRTVDGMEPIDEVTDAVKEILGR